VATPAAAAGPPDTTTQPMARAGSGLIATTSSDRRWPLAGHGSANFTGFRHPRCAGASRTAARESPAAGRHQPCAGGVVRRRNSSAMWGTPERGLIADSAITRRQGERCNPIGGNTARGVLFSPPAAAIQRRPGFWSNAWPRQPATWDMALFVGLGQVWPPVAVLNQPGDGDRLLADPGDSPGRSFWRCRPARRALPEHAARSN